MCVVPHGAVPCARAGGCRNSPKPLNVMHACASLWILPILHANTFDSMHAVAFTLGCMCIYTHQSPYGAPYVHRDEMFYPYLYLYAYQLSPLPPFMTPITLQFFFRQFADAADIVVLFNAALARIVELIIQNLLQHLDACLFEIEGLEVNGYVCVKTTRTTKNERAPTVA